jgi:hypothetical protein
VPASNRHGHRHLTQVMRSACQATPAKFEVTGQANLAIRTGNVIDINIDPIPIAFCSRTM